MPDLKQFKLPDVGEGLTEADILSWRVAVGDTVEVNQIVVEVETAKAAVELPSPYAGVVAALHCAEGETVDVGRPIITIDTAPGTGAIDTAPGSGAIDTAPGSGTTDGTAVGGAGEDLVPALPADGRPARQPVLVGYGPRAEGVAHRRRRAQSGTPSAQRAFDVRSPVPAPAEVPGAVAAAPEPEPARARFAHRVLAKPPVRQLAKTLGVDLAEIPATGPNGTVSRDDVQAAADGAQPTAPRAASSGARETRIPIKGVRKHMAAAMVASAFTAPHVTEFITVDVSATMDLRGRVAARSDFAGVKVSPLLFVAKAVLLAVQKTPEINATWDESAGEIVLKHYVNLGIAAATPRGLIVPNIKNAHAMALLDLARAMGELTETARAGRTSPAEMSGGTITITNVGVFGVDTGTPIINPGESAILAFGAVRRMPWVVGAGGDERIEARWVTQLAVAFDHRLVDGQQGSQFLADVASLLNDPGLAVL